MIGLLILLGWIASLYLSTLPLAPVLRVLLSCNCLEAILNPFVPESESDCRELAKLNQPLSAANSL